MSEFDPKKVAASDREGQVVVGVGEVLFDCFPNRKALGGAPMNVAVHAHQLLAPSGGYGVVVSRVGRDDLGRELVNQLNVRGIATNAIQVDSRLPTGTVNVKLNEAGEPTYEICEDVAWDNLRFEESLELLAADCQAACFGTLAQRSEPSRGTIQRFLTAAESAIRLFDVNLRQHYFDREVLETSLAAATVVKLNEQELVQIGELLRDSIGVDGDTDQRIERMRRSFDLDCVALTRGSEGTVLYAFGRRYESAQVTFKRQSNADNVGAGDACAAGLVTGLLRHWKPEQILDLANHMGAFVASQPGATPILPDELVNFSS